MVWGMKALVLSMACIGVASHAASGFSVSPGNWVVTNEVNGAPGRGMGIEVRDGTLVMAVYNYTNSGAATFHLTAGAMNGNQFRGELQSYAGGRHLGGAAQDATAMGSAGPVQIDFTSATTGTITFPGEQPQNISRYMFDGMLSSEFVRRNHVEHWFLTELDAKNRIVSASPMTLANSQGKLYTSEGTCSVSGDSFTCNVDWLEDWSQFITAKVTFKRFDRQMEGTISGTSSRTTNRVVGVRMVSGAISSTSASTINHLYDTPMLGWAEDDDSDGHHVPDSGMWIIDSENTGKPGRGMSLDLQANTLVMQLYGYEAGGNSTFHIGSGSYLYGKASVDLQKVRGGRYYGSGPLSGSNAGSDGKAEVQFTSNTTGRIRLPGEQWVDMQKFAVGRSAPTPESLLGTWVIWHEFAGNGVTKSVNLNRVSNGKALAADGLLQCGFEASEYGTVRCTGTNMDYRFKPAYGTGSSVGASMINLNPAIEDESEGPDLIIVQRIQDSSGVVSGSLNK